MHIRAYGVAIGSTIGVTALLLSGAVAAHAEVSDVVDQAIVDASLQNLGTEPLSDELASELVAGVDAATDAGVVDQTIIDVLTDSQAAESAQTDAAPSDADGSALPSDVEQLLDDHLESDQLLWDEISPAWLEAFETIRADFETCRASGSETSVCARTMGFSLQIAHAEAVIAELDAQAANVVNLPEEEQAAALAEIAAARVEVEAKLLRSQDRLAQVVASGSADPATTHAAEHAAKLEAVLAKVRDRQGGIAGADSTAGATVENENTTETNQAPAVPTPSHASTGPAPQSSARPGSDNSKSNNSGGNRSEGANNSGGSNKENKSR